MSLNRHPDTFRKATPTEWKPTPLSANVRCLKSTDLFEGTKEIGIDHGGSVYRLKITRQGKLILNK